MCSLPMPPSQQQQQQWGQIAHSRLGRHERPFGKPAGRYHRARPQYAYGERQHSHNSLCRLLPQPPAPSPADTDTRTKRRKDERCCAHPMRVVQRAEDRGVILRFVEGVYEVDERRYGCGSGSVDCRHIPSTQVGHHIVSTQK